jgi:hypothetical protein
MSSFEDIRLGWDGKSYLIPARKVLGAVARVEEVVTLQELLQYAQRGTAPMGRIAKAFGLVLRYAGADVEDEAVYLGMFGDGAAAADGGVQQQVLTAVTLLMQMMIPPEVRRKVEAGENVKTEAPVLAKGEEPKRGNRPATARGASKPTSRQRSRTGGARLQSSGI